MLTKTDKSRLIKICRVLFPDYKYISVSRRNNTMTFQKKNSWFSRLFRSKDIFSITEMVEFRIPKQLADFKYGDVSFINKVQEDLVRCDMNKINKINYFLEEITKIKYSDAYKQLKVIPELINPTPINVSTQEDEMFEEMIRLYREAETTKPAPVKSYWVSKEATFYGLLILIVLWSCINNLIQ